MKKIIKRKIVGGFANEYAIYAIDDKGQLWSWSLLYPQNLKWVKCDPIEETIEE